jgi:hypothetical protein
MSEIPDQDLRDSAPKEYPELAAPAPEGYQFPPGTPAEVPADFAAARDAQLATQLSAEEIAEFRQLRDEKKKRDAAAAEEAAAAAARLSAPTHDVHLSTGDVVDGSTIATHYATEAGALIPVTGTYLKPELVTL